FAFQAKQMALEIAVGLAGEFVADLDALEPVFPDDPAPEGVVQVQHDAFLRVDFLRRNHASQHAADVVPEGLCVRLAIQLPFSSVVRLLDSRRQHESMKVEEAYALQFPDFLGPELGDGTE